MASHILRAARLFYAAIVTAVTICFIAPALADVEFRHALDDSVLDVGPIKGEEFTDAVKSFHKTGENPYRENAEAVAKGKERYDELCSACHNPDASGKMGPSLIDNVASSERANTDVGMFEVIHSGSSGAMRSFAQRGVTQDEILKIMSYVASLKK